MDYNNDLADNVDSNDCVMDQIYMLEKILNKIEIDIKLLWDDIILPYLNDVNKRKILYKLIERGYPEFYKFMINNNNTYNTVINKLNILYSTMK